ncbi:MAG: hypothetical protein P8J20_08460 [Novosphingobium sp.]|nr:hypothetical protein [Novosphingobium sp.]
MPRVAPKSPVNPKVFRHFVVITVAITFLLAMFSDGENREAFEQQLAEKSEKKRLEQAELEMAKQGKGGNTSLVFKDNRAKKTSWRSDPGNPSDNYVPIESTGGADGNDDDFAPELVADRSPQFVDPAKTVDEPEHTLAGAPPGMSSEAIKALQKKKKRAKPLNRKRSTERNR